MRMVITNDFFFCRMACIMIKMRIISSAMVRKMIQAFKPHRRDTWLLLLFSRIFVTMLLGFLFVNHCRFLLYGIWSKASCLKRCYKPCHLRPKTVAMEEVEINIQSLFPFIVDDWRIIVQMLNGCNGYSWCKWDIKRGKENEIFDWQGK